MQEFIRSIPQTQPIVHNDFSNMGLPPPLDNWDTMSVTSITASAVPYTQVLLPHYSKTGTIFFDHNLNLCKLQPLGASVYLSGLRKKYRQRVSGARIKEHGTVLLKLLHKK